MKSKTKYDSRYCIVSTLFCGLLLLGACKPEAKQGALPSQPPTAPVEVRVAAASQGVAEDREQVVGTLEAVQRATIAAKVTGTIAEMPVVLGSMVKKDGLLVRLHAAEIAARLSQTETAAAQARRNLEREQRLLAKNASTRETVNSLEEAYRMARGVQNEAGAMLGYTTIRAPFAGRVTRKPANIGDLATVGMPLLELENTDTLQAVAAVPESRLATIKPGDTLPVRIPDMALEVSGTVAEIAPAADASSRTVTVKLDLHSDAPLRPGQFVRVILPGTASRTLLVPEAAVSVFGQMERLFVVEESPPAPAEEGAARVHLRLVRTGLHREGQVEILSGIDPGEQVVVESDSQLTDGQAVRIAP